MRMGYELAHSLVHFQPDRCLPVSTQLALKVPSTTYSLVLTGIPATAAFLERD
jgi:hypothetical protein